MTDFATARLNMVEGQVKPNKVTDPAIIDAMLEIPRELFVPAAMRGIAYVDEDLPIGRGRYLVEPMVLARMIQEAEIGPGDVVLDVGCTAGYSTAVMARLANTVVAVESDHEFAQQAGTLLSQLGVDNAVVMEGALTDGYPAQAPYQRIIVSGAVAEVPAALTDQLADDGRLVAVVAGPPGSVGVATLFRRTGSAVTDRPLFDAGTPILPGFERKPVFEF